MKNIKRIAIIGNAGSGKSTLTQKLHKITNLPVYYLDQYFWKPGWVRTDADEYKKAHDAICDKEEWIIDGINLRVMEYRIQRADVIIFLDIPRYICLWRILKRTFKYYGKETLSSPKGCPERFNWEFLKFLKWVWDFKKKYPPAIMELLKQYSDKKQIYVFKSQQDVNAFVIKFKRMVQ
jgi:adenylate kinase family enzyme